MEIHHFSHPKHPLVVLDDYKDKPVECSGCEQSISDTSYGCSRCKFFLHKSCAEQPMMFMHSSHVHPLVLHYREPYYPGRCYCYGCRRSISGHFYACFDCGFFLHASCAMLPTEIDHPLHTQHKLSLVPSPLPYRDGSSCVCNACLKSLEGFTYHCFRCRFDLHTVCATLPSTIASNRHPHPLTLFLKLASFSCDDCRTNVQGISYLCYTCQFWVDLNCALLSNFTSTNARTARIEYHPHPLTAVLISELNRDPYEKMYCDICETDIAKSKTPVFHCAMCHFFAHVGCATLLKQALSKDEDQELRSEDTILMDDEEQDQKKKEEQDPYPFLNRTYNEFVGSLARGVEEISLRENERVPNLTHFTHGKHSLIHGDELKHDRMCGMCMQKISSPFFGCTECNFFLHELCAKLPRHKKHPLEPHHPLTLHRTEDDFSCSNCDKSIYGFFYGCDDQDCNFKLDLRCGAMVDILKHEGHEHPLYLVEERSSKECNACCNSCVGNTYVCVVCDFYLEAKCAVLPLTARHRDDKHLLTLVCHSDDDELGQFTCEPCDSERDPKPWFYECVPCRFTAHLECINGKYRNI